MYEKNEFIFNELYSNEKKNQTEINVELRYKNKTDSLLLIQLEIFKIYDYLFNLCHNFLKF